MQTCKYHAWTTASPCQSVEGEDGFEGENGGPQNTHPNAKSWPVVIQAQRKQTARPQQSVGANPPSSAFLSTMTKPPSPSLYATTSWQTECNDPGQLKGAAVQELVPCHVIWPAILGRCRCSTSSAGRDVKVSRPQTSWATGNICETEPNQTTDILGYAPNVIPSKGYMLFIIAPQLRQVTAKALTGKHCFIGPYEAAT